MSQAVYRSCRLCCILLCLLWSASALADNMQRSRRHFQSGQVAFAEGRYGKAKAEFLRAYDLAPLPDLLFNLGRVCERLGENQAAADYLARFLVERPEVPDAPQIRADIARLQGRPRIEFLTPGQQKPPPALWPPLTLAGAGLAVFTVGVALTATAQAQPAQSRNRSMLSAGIALDVIGGTAFLAGAIWTGVVLYQRRNAARPPLTLLPTPQGVLLSGIF